MRAYQNVFLEFKRVAVWKKMLVISEYTKNFIGILLWNKDIVFNEDIMKEWGLSSKNSKFCLFVKIIVEASVKVKFTYVYNSAHLHTDYQYA
jgi:hypothetical protein